MVECKHDCGSDDILPPFPPYRIGICTVWRKVSTLNVYVCNHIVTCLHFIIVFVLTCVVGKVHGFVTLNNKSPSTSWLNVCLDDFITHIAL